MRRLGDLDVIRARSGLMGAIKAVVSSPMFLLGVLCMALELLHAAVYACRGWTFRWRLLRAPRLRLSGMRFAAKFFLRENVDQRRWLAALFVCVGVALLAR